ncbi:MAG: M20/M25/M40 family metallo-hydrolase [Desulfobacteraceae bacterium]|jgi:tripeptide aminopeptidase
MGKVVINKDRLAQSFVGLVKIDSVSKEEGALCRFLQTRLSRLGVETLVDDAGVAVGGDSGNLIGRFHGNRTVAPLLLSAHMDTVEPGRGVRPVLVDGIFRSGGETVLGADDKCGIAIILEALACIVQDRRPCGPLELVFSVCEEIGLQGAKHLAYDQLTARMGYVLDTRNPEVIITRAPAAHRITLQVDGKAAHAGAEPEKGVNAIALAAKAIAALELGRIDAETTCNIGIIEGGVATNIVPAKVVIQGEVRSHDRAKLSSVTDNIVQAFQKAVNESKAERNGFTAELSVEVALDFDLLAVPQDHDVVKLAHQAAANLHRKIYTASSGGGSDANILNQHGIAAGVLGTGCENVHTVQERVALDDMVRAAELLVEIIRIHAETTTT